LSGDDQTAAFDAVILTGSSRSQLAHVFKDTDPHPEPFLAVVIAMPMDTALTSAGRR